MSAGAPELLSMTAIRAAQARIAGKINRTPVLTSATLNAMTKGSLWFKCENLQKAGAFKARGATNAVFSLGQEQAARGVATHSSGNHAAALARAAGLRGIPAYIVMPTSTVQFKQDSVRRYGGQITLCEPTLEARAQAAAQIVAATGAAFVHPYDDIAVMAGQGSAAVELLEECAGLDVLLAPVGGGGLISGTAVAVRNLSPKTRVIGVEPAGADDAYRSFKSGVLMPAGNPKTIADGLRGALSAATFAHLRAFVDDVVLVSDEAILRAMRLIWEVMKIVVEPSGAVPFAALIEQRIDVQDKKVGLILTGGNLDLGRVE